MNRIEQKFRELRKIKKKALSVFLTAGYPSIDTTESLVLELEKCGVDFFEIGFPFSDPIADGPTIQHSSEIALKRGMRWEKAIRLCKNIRKRSDVPLVLMSYANPLFCRGWKNSIHALASAGFDGVIIPDLIPEESDEIQALFVKNGLCLIYLLSPTSAQVRIETIIRKSAGFVYCVSVTGVTGARKDLPFMETNSFLRTVKKYSSLPILLGFGISRSEQIKKFKESADGFVIGSALIKKLEDKIKPDRLVQMARRLILPFVKECKR